MIFFAVNNTKYAKNKKHTTTKLIKKSSQKLIYDSESDIIILFSYFVIKSKYMYEGLNSFMLNPAITTPELESTSITVKYFFKMSISTLPNMFAISSNSTSKKSYFLKMEVFLHLYNCLNI